MNRYALILLAVVYGSFNMLAQTKEWKKSPGGDEIISISHSVPSESKTIRTEIHCTGLENNLLGDSPEREVIIYLPPGYENSLNQHYPVIYFLHGYTQQPGHWLGLFADIPRIMDTLVNHNKIIPMIVVLPNSCNKYRGSYYTNSPVTGNWEDFIVDNLVQYIDSNFRTLPQAESRGIAGH